jgi:Na+-translocating ferredoxin:NAD+ oxidoreductase RnfC subunit
MLVAEVNADTSSKLIIKMSKDKGVVWLNGHPFQSAAQAGSAIMRKLHQLEMQRRRSESGSPAS